MHKTNEEIRTLLNKQGIKITPQRMAVYAALQALGHASAEQITKAVHDTFPTVTVGTIYNVLECFSSRGIISRLNTSDNKMYFDIHTHDHHHLVCEETGEIHDFGDRELSDLVRAYYATHKKPMGENFEVKDIRIQIIGNFKHSIQQ